MGFEDQRWPDDGGRESEERKGESGEIWDLKLKFFFFKKIMGSFGELLWPICLKK